MCYMSGSIQMENIYIPENEAGLWQWLFGKNVTSLVLLNNGSSDGFIGIAAPHLARILPVCIIPNFGLMTFFSLYSKVWHRLWFCNHHQYHKLCSVICDFDFYFIFVDWFSNVWWWTFVPGTDDFLYISSPCMLRKYLKFLFPTCLHCWATWDIVTVLSDVNP